MQSDVKGVSGEGVASWLAGRTSADERTNGTMGGLLLCCWRLHCTGTRGGGSERANEWQAVECSARQQPSISLEAGPRAQ